MSRVPSPSLDECLNELYEDTSQLTQLTLKQQASGGSLEVEYTTNESPSPFGGLTSTAYIVKENP